MCTHPQTPSHLFTGQGETQGGERVRLTHRLGGRGAGRRGSRGCWGDRSAGSRCHLAALCPREGRLAAPPEVFCPGAVRCESLQPRPRAFPGAAGPTQRFPRPRLPPRAPGPGCCSGSLEASLCAALPDSSPQPGPPDAPHLGQELIRPGCPRPLTVSPAGCLPRRMTSRWGPP